MILFMWVRNDFVRLMIRLIRFRWEERTFRSKSRPETWRTWRLWCRSLWAAVSSAFAGLTVFFFLSQVNKPSITLRWQNLNADVTITTKESAVRLRTIAKQFILPFVVTSGGPCPPWMHFLPARGSLLLLCPSWVMDYLSAISQSNHIQRCSSSCPVCFKDDAALHFLFALPVLLLHAAGVSSIDFQLFSFCFFYLRHWGFCLYLWPEICILKVLEIILLGKKVCFLQSSALVAFQWHAL